MTDKESRIIYLDNHATTRCDPRVVEAMQPYFLEAYGNPSSTVHAMGRDADDAISNARGQVAELIGAHPKEIIFTSGATESNNLAILGIARASDSGRKKIVTTTIEHKSILNACKQLENEGFEVVELPVDSCGRVDMATATREIDEYTLMVSTQAASNEIGTIQAIKELADLSHEYGALMHCDAAQATGKIPVDVDEWRVDLLSLSSHKMYGPKGIGALYLRGGPFAHPVEPLLWGGGQEQELRSGTLNVPAIVGLGVSASLVVENLAQERQRLSRLRGEFEGALKGVLVEVKLNGDLENRLPGNSSLTFAGIDAEALITRVPSLMLSTGSACTSGAPEPSYVLEAIGLSRKEAYCTIRVCFGRFNTNADATKAAEMLTYAITEMGHPVL